jgi:hypothetical protein
MTNQRYRTFDGDGHSILVICGRLGEFPGCYDGDSTR